MGPLLQIYVTLSALTFKFVTALQDGKSHVLFYFLILLCYHSILRSFGYCLLSCFNLNFLMKKKKTLSSPLRLCADIYVLQCLKDRRS